MALKATILTLDMIVQSEAPAATMPAMGSKTLTQAGDVAERNRPNADGAHRSEDLASPDTQKDGAEGNREKKAMAFEG